MIWFTADLHYSHENIIRHCGRPFNDVAEMNDTLVGNINSLVDKNDSLYIVGDIAMKRTMVDEFLERINCLNVHLIKGNHDPDNVKPGGVLKSVHDYKFLKTEDLRLVLFHYPIFEWYHKRQGVVHLHGHTHGTIEDQKLVYGRNDLSFDVGVDVTDYVPISLDTVHTLVAERLNR